MIKLSEPLMRSRLDTDWYKFTMGNYIHEVYPDYKVKFGFTCRTPNLRLGSTLNLDIIRTQFEMIRDMSFTQSELTFLNGVKGHPLSENYLELLKTTKLPEVFVDRDPSTEDLIIETAEDSWALTSQWEIPILYVVSCLANLQQVKKDAKTVIGSLNLIGQMASRLIPKIEQLKKHPDIQFFEFGTRRRFHSDTQHMVLEALLEAELGGAQLLGTSNVHWAKELNLPPVGTNAHELQMVPMAMALRECKDKTLEEYQSMAEEYMTSLFRTWKAMYPDFDTCLTDTYGSSWVFKNCLETIKEYQTVRQDSGDPHAFNMEYLECCKKNGIDSTSKTVVHSDGLILPNMIKLWNIFHKNFERMIFGWGTNLTSDLGLTPMSLICKPMSVNGIPTVKLSDNINKAMGPVLEIARYKKIFSYTNQTSMAVTY